MSLIKSPLQLGDFLTDVLLALAELDLASLENAALVCKRWKSLTETKTFWSQVVTRRWTTDLGIVEPGRKCLECIYRILLFRYSGPRTASEGIFLLSGPPRSVPPSNPRSWIRALARLKKSIHLLQTAEPPFHFSGFNSETGVSDVLPFLLLDDPNENVQDNVENHMPFRMGEEVDEEVEQPRGRMYSGDESWLRFWGKETSDQWKGDPNRGMRKWFPSPVSFLCRPSHANGNVQCCVFVDVSLVGYLYGFVQAVVLSESDEYNGEGFA